MAGNERQYDEQWRANPYFRTPQRVVEEAELEERRDQDRVKALNLRRAMRERQA